MVVTKAHSFECHKSALLTLINGLVPPSACDVINFLQQDIDRTAANVACEHMCHKRALFRSLITNLIPNSRRDVTTLNASWRAGRGAAGDTSHNMANTRTWRSQKLIVLLVTKAQS